MTLTARLPYRAYIAFIHDIAMTAASFVLSLYLRLGSDVFRFVSPEVMVKSALVFTVIAAVVFRVMGLYRGVWRYASLNDLLAITRAVSVTVMVFLLVMFAWTRLEELPRSIPFINWFVLMALLGGPRFVYRTVKDRRIDLRLLQNRDQDRVPVLLAGAGDGAELFLRALSRAAHPGYRVVGILAEKWHRVGHNIHGVNVMGTLSEMDAVVDRLARRGEAPQRLVLTRDDMDGAQVRALLDSADSLGMILARLPRMTDFKSGLVDEIEVRPVAVEDLLGRPQMPLDRAAMRSFIEGRRILVTGAGGSIGRELVSQVVDFSPAQLALVDHSEFALYTVDQEVAAGTPGFPVWAVLADVRDRGRVDAIFAEFRPEVVFHAAALKHVPLVEANLFEGITTNVLGTVNIADASREAGVSTMVLVSTDKAVNPTNLMGATKRIAETYCQVLDLHGDGDHETRFVTVRFGNVLGSTGSVVPLFQKQLAAGGPLTVTDPNMTRYFMTIREAVELVLEASALGGRGPRREGKIFVLEMGEPVRIIDLARQMIRLAGLRPEEDIAIEITGPRPGEKISEEIFHHGEPLVPTECAGILLAAPRATDGPRLARAIDDLTAACADADAGRAIDLICALVPEYTPSPEVATVRPPLRAAAPGGR